MFLIDRTKLPVKPFFKLLEKSSSPEDQNPDKSKKADHEAYLPDDDMDILKDQDNDNEGKNYRTEIRRKAHDHICIPAAQSRDEV
jgi:hypothetical protein